MAKDVALIVGVGPGLGAALARRFAQGGLAVAVAARHVLQFQAAEGRQISTHPGQMREHVVELNAAVAQPEVLLRP